MRSTPLSCDRIIQTHIKNKTKILDMEKYWKSQGNFKSDGVGAMLSETYSHY